MKRALHRLSIASILISPLMYVIAGLIVVWRSRVQFSSTELAKVLVNEHVVAFDLFSAAPLIEVSLASWLLSLWFERCSRTEQRARFGGLIVAFLCAIAFSVWSAEEALAAPILHLQGASTSAFAFVFLPLNGGIVVAVGFLSAWLLLHAVTRMGLLFKR